MPTIHDLKNSQFLTKEDVDPAVKATIKSYELMDVSMENESRKDKYVLHFEELDKPMVLNVTNGSLIAAITGSEDFDGWIGQTIVLYNDKSIMFQGKITGGIRVRAMKKQETPPAKIDSDDIPF